MTAFVCDASVALSWCFVDEAGPETDALLEIARIQGAVVPDLWRLEIANVIAAAERRGRITITMARGFLNALNALPLTVERGTERRAFSELFQIARGEALTVYDAVYLDLAQRRSLPLATKDRALATAARRNGLPLMLTT